MRHTDEEILLAQRLYKINYKYLTKSIMDETYTLWRESLEKTQQPYDNFVATVVGIEELRKLVDKLEAEHNCA